MQRRTRRTWTPKDKAEALLLLAHNDGNVRRTAREFGVSPSVIRDWRDRSADDPDFAVEDAKSDVFDEIAPKYEDSINKHFVLISRGLDAAISTGYVPELREIYRLAGTMDLLAQRLLVVRGEATGRTEVQHTIDLTGLQDELEALRSETLDMRDAAIQRARAVKAIEGEIFEGSAEEVDELPHEQE